MNFLENKSLFDFLMNFIDFNIFNIDSFCGRSFALIDTFKKAYYLLDLFYLNIALLFAPCHCI